MFGYPCAFVNGNMFTGLFQDSMMLRLAEKERAAFLELLGARQFEPMPGRIMKEYVVVPEALLTEGSKLRRWVIRSFEYASSLPAKRKAAASGARPAARRATR